ncbi:DNA topoisomerase I [Achromatium sp. WMS1]|nr:DNA topoisomerase I [Achromatium sp. WMS1]
MPSKTTHLVVVESPAKAKTIKKYLGDDFEVLASYGHVRDLVPKGGAVNPKKNFQMRYQLIERNERHVQAISRSIKNAQSLYLATDPDREGEAIAWHLCELLQERNLINDKPIHRIVFHEITQQAVQEALANPRTLSIDLINAQQARRALDYLVGFKLSPLLWRKIRRGLSAGRVQSPALRLIVEREHEITAFIVREYWSIEAIVAKKNRSFVAKLVYFQGNKLKQFSITDATQAEQIKATLIQVAAGQLQVEKVENKQRKRQPAPPFTTSTLQQEAARKLGFTANKTMSTAQQLYEGVDIGNESVGLITYMRTDSVNLAREAITEIRNFIKQQYGSKHCPQVPRIYKTKAKNAQEAHEAIRPTSVLRLPTDLSVHLTKDQLKLYGLIWKRTIACQMRNALFNVVVADLSCGSLENLFRATGSVLVEAEFMQVYLEGEDDVITNDEGAMLPNLAPKDLVTLHDINPNQHFTEPPPRYTEASLVKTLEEYGIGRPSTYASIISTLQERKYVKLNKKRFYPTDVGQVVNRFLTTYFTKYVDYNFTAHLENELDAVACGEMDWLPLLEQFWQPFKERIEHTNANVNRDDVINEATDEICPKCGSSVSIKLGFRGRFIGCNRYPECDYTKDLGTTDQFEQEDTQILVDKTCPECGSPLVVKQGRYSRFVGCSAYPKCKHTESLHPPRDTGVLCPKCGQGNLMQRRSRRNQPFYSCATYPKCDYLVWNVPIAEPCPECGWPILVIRNTKKFGQEKVCPQKDCNFKVAMDTDTPVSVT